MTYPMSDRDREIQEEPLAAGWEARGELRRPGAARRFPTSKTVGADGGARRYPPSHGCLRTARFHSGPERKAAEDGFRPGSLLSVQDGPDPIVGTIPVDARDVAGVVLGAGRRLDPEARPSNHAPDGTGLGRG